MPLDNSAIFAIQFVLSILVFSLIAVLYVWPRLKGMNFNRALMALVFMHSLRHLGLAFLSSSAVGAGITTTSFAAEVAYGDLLAVILALISIFALLARSRAAVLLVTIFNVVGFADLLNAMYKGTQVGVTNQFLGAWWVIPTFIAPFLLVMHATIFAVLIKRKSWKK